MFPFFIWAKQADICYHFYDTEHKTPTTCINQCAHKKSIRCFRTHNETLDFQKIFDILRKNQTNKKHESTALLNGGGPIPWYNIGYVSTFRYQYTVPPEILRNFQRILSAAKNNCTPPILPQAFQQIKVLYNTRKTVHPIFHFIQSISLSPAHVGTRFSAQNCSQALKRLISIYRVYK